MTNLTNDARAARQHIAIVHAEGEAQLRAWTETANRTTDRPSTFDDLCRFLTRTPNQLRSIAYLGNEPVATACAVPDWLKQQGSMIVALRVIEEHRRRGIGNALHNDLIRWMQRANARTYEVTVRDTAPETVAFWELRGCREVERDVVVALDTRAYTGPAEPAPGITITSLADRPDLLHDVYTVGAATWPDIPVHEPCTVLAFDEWRGIIEGHSENTPEALFIACFEGRVVGYGHLALPPTTPDVGWHNFTGVRREYRGRGIARSLKQHEIEWARKTGRFTLMTGNHEDNSPIRHLNDTLGYRHLYAEITMQGTISER